MSHSLGRGGSPMTSIQGPRPYNTGRVLNMAHLEVATAVALSGVARAPRARSAPRSRGARARPAHPGPRGGRRRCGRRCVRGRRSRLDGISVIASAFAREGFAARALAYCGPEGRDLALARYRRVGESTRRQAGVDAEVRGVPSALRAAASKDTRWRRPIRSQKRSFSGSRSSPRPRTSSRARE